MQGGWVCRLISHLSSVPFLLAPLNGLLEISFVAETGLGLFFWVTPPKEDLRFFLFAPLDGLLELSLWQKLDLGFPFGWHLQRKTLQSFLFAPLNGLLELSLVAETGLWTFLSGNTSKRRLVVGDEVNIMWCEPVIFHAMRGTRSGSHGPSHHLVVLPHERAHTELAFGSRIRVRELNCGWFGAANQPLSCIKRGRTCR